MKNTYYPAVFHPEEVGYSVFVPDIEGCSTQGDTVDEAVEMAKDAIGLMLEGLSEYPQASIPSAQTLAEGEFVVMIPFYRPFYRLSFPPGGSTCPALSWCPPTSPSSREAPPRCLRPR